TFLMFFLSLHHPHLNSTLFPYTTLFRSPRASGCRPPPTRCRERSIRSGQRSRGSTTRCCRNCVPFPASRRREWHAVSATARCRTNRKSTRLNSSHDQISYAVFCLKKKNT